MSAGVALLADAADASLVGSPGGDGPVVAFGEMVAGASPAVRWIDREAGDAEGAGARVIAVAGKAWRRAPWPAADELFELAPPAGAAAILTGGDHDLRGAIEERAAERGVSLEVRDRLKAELIASGAVVVLAESPGAALPARAPAVLAARRLLLVPRLATTFGLQAGLDHLQFADPDEAVTFVEAYRRAPDAFRRVLEWGTLSARPHRASVVFGRLGPDLLLDGSMPSG